ncbi:MAG: hypothetical protein ACJ716_01665 [Marmoricola sp.]
MDLSGIIFVVLAVGWAVYLLPKALKHHDDADLSRPVEEFSNAVRVLGRVAVPALLKSSDVASDEADVAQPEATPPTPLFTVSREAARAAARRRRRVLALLLTTLVAVSAASYLGYTPWFTTAIPAGLVLAFLVVARLTVRAQQVRRTSAPVAHATPVVAEDARPEAPVQPLENVEPDLGTEDTAGLSRAELADAVAAPVLDEGGLWDPLPVTLPTYVTKPRARRTVRTIELTAGSTGITSSGHDAADSALAAEAAASEKEAVAEEAVEAPKAAGA